MTEHEGGRAVQPPRIELCKTQTHLDSLSIGKQPSPSLSLPCVHVIVAALSLSYNDLKKEGNAMEPIYAVRMTSTLDKKNSH